MKLVTRFELVAKDENELRGLLRKVINELARSDPRSYERRNALASIENIQSELNFYTLPRGMNVVHTHLAVVLSTIIARFQYLSFYGIVQRTNEKADRFRCAPIRSKILRSYPVFGCLVKPGVTMGVEFINLAIS